MFPLGEKRLVIWRRSMRKFVFFQHFRSFLNENLHVIFVGKKCKRINEHQNNAVNLPVMAHTLDFVGCAPGLGI